MNQTRHGGDIYNNKVKYDFSVNTNPLGTSEKIRTAIADAVMDVNVYPEYDSVALKEKLAGKLGIPADQIVITNGASEAFLAICHSRLYSSGIVVCPSFFGYEYALDSVGARMMGLRYESLWEGNLDPEYEVLFIANPNNPTGTLISHDVLLRIIDQAADMGMDVVIDECFLPLTPYENESIIYDMARDPQRFLNVSVVRSFTKTFAIPGVRLGYIVTAASFLADSISSHVPEWNVSSIAQRAGIAALDCIDELPAAVKLIESERERLQDALIEAGFGILPSDANFILFRGPSDLGDKLLEKGILIRDCSNFVGLEPGDYRIAVKNVEENDAFIEALGCI